MLQNDNGANQAQARAVSGSSQAMLEKIFQGIIGSY